MITISVVIPVYNTAQYIEKCIESLLAQNYPKDQYEIIMVDNGSTDGSVDIIQKYPRIRLLFEPQKGSYAARNKGIAHARGKIIAFTDSDCIAASDWLNKIGDGMKQPGIKIILGRLRYPSDSPALLKIAAYEQERACFIFSSNVREIYFGYTNNMAISADVFNELGYFAEINRGSDTLYVQKLLDSYRCASVLYLPDMWVEHAEIGFLYIYYRKMNIYGRNRRRSDHLATMRSLNFNEKLNIFKRVIQNQEYSFIDSVHLLLLLGVGVFFFNFGYRNIKKR